MLLGQPKMACLYASAHWLRFVSLSQKVERCQLCVLRYLNLDRCFSVHCIYSNWSGSVLVEFVVVAFDFHSEEDLDRRGKNLKLCRV